MFSHVKKKKYTNVTMLGIAVHALQVWDQVQTIKVNINPSIRGETS
jgi:hypothetical protein